MKLRVDMSQFTFGDAVELEEQGFTLRQMQESLAAGEVPVRLAVVLIWLFRRKEEPTFTLDDAKNVPLLDGLDIEVVGDDADPKAEPAAGSPPSASAPDGSLTTSNA